MVQYVLFSFISRSIFFLLRPLNQSKFVCDTLAGIIIGPSVLGRIPMISARFYSAQQMLMVNTLATIAISLYVFIMAMKLDTTIVMKMEKGTWTIALSCLVAPMLLVVFLVEILHPRFPDLPKELVLLLIGASISCTAFIDVAPILDELNLSTTNLAQLTMSSAVLNDFFLWLFWLMCIIVRGRRAPFLMLLYVLGFLLVVLFVLRPAVMQIVKEAPDGQPVKEIYITAILLAALIMGQISSFFSGSCFFGSLLAGLVVPEGPPLGSAIVQRAETFIMGCTMPFFYLAVGAHVNVAQVSNWKSLIVFQSILILGYLAKLLGTMLPSLCCKLSIRHACIISLIMNVQGVLETALYRNMFLHKRLPVPFYNELVLTSVAVTAILTPLIKVLYELPNRSEDEPLEFYGMSIDLTHKLGSDTRIVLCVHTEDDVPGLLRLLEASNNTETSCMEVYVVHLNELIGRASPLFAYHEKHNRICKHNGCVSISNALGNYSRNSEGKVILEFFTMIVPYRSMHEGVCGMARDFGACLIIIPFQNWKHSFSSQGNESLLSFESNIQAYSPCTVGILVERKMPLYIQKDQDFFSYRVIVIFIGGQDDREALAYASRMVSHPLLEIMILRILIKDEINVKKKEEVLDESLVKEFKRKNMKNPRAFYKEVKVDDWEGAVGFVRSFNFIGFDLVMVGKLQGECSLRYKEMTALTDRPELGFLGDMLASSDFHGQTFSVLVMQHFIPLDDNSLLWLMC